MNAPLTASPDGAGSGTDAAVQAAWRALVFPPGYRNPTRCVRRSLSTTRSSAVAGPGSTSSSLVALDRGVTLGSLAALVLPYPTRSAYLRRLIDGWSRTRLTPRAARTLRWWLKLTL